MVKKPKLSWTPACDLRGDFELDDLKMNEGGGL